MIPLRLTRNELPAELPGELEGLVLVRELRDPDGGRGLPKGSVLDRDSAGLLAELPWEELHLVRPEPGEIHERPAGRRLAVAAAGEGVEVGSFGGGHWPIRTLSRGLLEVRPGPLASVNGLEGLSVYAHLTGRVVDAGEAVARAKVIPFVVSGRLLERAEERARESGGVVAVHPFRETVLGAVVQETLRPGGAERFRAALEEKATWFGARLLEPRFTAPEVGAVAGALEGVLEEGAELVAVAGTRAMDPLDPAFQALERTGGAMVRHGVPAHPGSLLWLARVRGVPVVGVPTCGLFSRATVFDLVLSRILARLPVGPDELAELGHGGFLTSDMSWRFPPYRKTGARGEV